MATTIEGVTARATQLYTERIGADGQRCAVFEVEIPKGELGALWLLDDRHAAERFVATAVREYLKETVGSI